MNIHGTDPRLNEYYNNKRIRQCLIKAGLINRHGDILPPPFYEVILRGGVKRSVIEKTRKREAFIRNQLDLVVKRSRVEKIRESKHPHRRAISNSSIHIVERPKTGTSRTSSPTTRKRSPIRTKSAHHSPKNVKTQLIRRPTAAKKVSNDNYCEVTMIYYGPQTGIDYNNSWYQPDGDEIVVMQQHCGGENLTVFKGFIRPNEIFTFESPRHPDFPFALALYVNGLIDSRISVCCEYKHKHNVRLGSKSGLFGIYDVQKSLPCRSCRFEKRRKAMLLSSSNTISSSNYQSSNAPRIPTPSKLRPLNLLRTPSPPSEVSDENRPTKYGTNRISTTAQASRSPKRLSFASSVNDDKLNEVHVDEPKHDSTLTSDQQDDRSSTPDRQPINRKSDPPSPIISFKNEDTRLSPNQSSAGKKKDSDTLSRSSVRASIQSDPSLIAPLEEENDQHSSKVSTGEINNNERSLSRASTKSDSSSSLIFVENEDIPRKKSDGKLSTTTSSDTLTPSDSFSEDEYDNQKSKMVTKKNNADATPSPITSTKSGSSSKNKDDEESIKRNNDTRSSSSSSSREIDDYPLLLNDQNEEKRHSPTSSSSEDSEHSIKNDSESRCSSSSSTDNQNTNDIDAHDQLKTPSETEDDANTKLIPKQSRYDENKSDNDNEEVELPASKVEKNAVRRYRPVENIIIVWLDAAVDNTGDDILSSKTQLRQIARTIRTFSEPEKCIQFIAEIKYEKVFLIVSGRLSEDILQQIDTYSQLAVVYIYCQENSKYEHLMGIYPKVKGIFVDISTICEHLKKDSKQWDNDLNTFQTISLIDNNQLNPEQLLFIQNQLFKEYLLEIEYEKDAIHNLIEYCQNLYAENDTELELIHQFEENYNPNDALHWYTKDCFAYHMLNRAIRMKDIKVLFEMGFFLRDINQQLEKYYSTTTHRSTLTVFRGQGMKLEYFEELKQNQGGLISFNGFLSTSVKQNIAYEFAQQSLSNGFPIAVLFRIRIDPTNTSTPFASLEDLSSNRSEYEILFSLKTLFRIEPIEQIQDNLWQIDLVLINEKQNELSQYIQIEREKWNNLINYEKLSELLIEMNELDKAKDLYEINVPSISDPKYTYVYNQLALVYTKLENYNQALLYYNLSLQTKSNETLTDYVTLSNIHNQIGKIFHQQNKLREALDKFQYALNLQLEHLPSQHPSLVNTYDLLAMTYAENDDYQRSLEYHEKQLEIQEELFVFDQSDLAPTHFKIAICLENLNRFNEAIDHLQQSIDMSRPDDPELNNRQAALERIREQLE